RPSVAAVVRSGYDHIIVLPGAGARCDRAVRVAISIAVTTENAILFATRAMRGSAPSHRKRESRSSCTRQNGARETGHACACRHAIDQKKVPNNFLVNEPSLSTQGTGGRCGR